MEHLYKMIELSGSSKIGVEDAVKRVVEKAGESMRHLSWFEVVETRGSIKDGKIDLWQVVVKIGFNVE